MFSYVAFSFAVATTLLQFGNTIDFSEEIPTECKNEEICYQKPATYPSEEIDNFFQERQTQSNFTLLYTQRDYYNEDVEVPAPDGLNCYLKAEIKTPYLVKVKSTWKPVVQSQYFTQKIKEVKCDNEGESCMTMVGFLKRATCATKFASILIQFYDPLEKEVKMVNKMVAVCCTCNIREY